MTVKEFIKSCSAAMGNMDLSTLEPMSNFMFHPLWAKEWIEKVEEIIKRLEEKEISIQELVKSIPGPSHLRAQFFFLLLDLKCARIEKQRRIKIADFFLQLLIARATDDPFGWKSNKIHTQQEIKEIIQKIKFNQGTEETAKLLGRLYTASYHFINGLYTDFYTDYGAEYFGEYQAEELGKGYTLVIKPFHDLKPELLWPEISPPCKKLTIYSIYKDVKFTCDAISVHSIYTGDPIKGLIKWAVEVDGKFIDSIDEIKKIKNQLEICSVEQWKKLISLEFEKLKKKGLAMRNYTLKKMFERLGIDWKPSQKMIDAVKDKPFVDESFWGASPDWEKLMDPEVEFYPSN